MFVLARAADCHRLVGGLCMGRISMHGLKSGSISGHRGDTGPVPAM